MSAPAQRRFLFLQGNASWFFRRLGEAVDARGHGVLRVNICGGDWWFWGDWNAVDYTGGRDGFGRFVASLCRERGITDAILHNDTRDVHRAAIAHARAAGVRVWVFEEGYLRPHWLTLEQGGINGFSPLPKDPHWYRREAARLGPPPAPVPVGAGTRRRILYDFRWQWANYRYLYRWPRYRTHRPYPIWAEYATWTTRLATLKWRQAQARRAVSELCGGSRPFFLFPLQLDSDSQIRLHSPFGRMLAATEHVIGAFAAHAPADARLVVKNHPLDNGWIDYRRHVRRFARRAGVGARVRFIDGGDLNALIDHARGTVTVNSTVGLTALERGASTLCLGTAVYDVPGLTAQVPLEAFWHAAPLPDRALYDAYRRVLLHRALINGNYYTDEGVRLGVANALARLQADAGAPGASTHAASGAA